MALSVAAARRPAPATVEAADFNRVRRSMAVIPDHEMMIAIIACGMMGCDYFGGKTSGDTLSTPHLPYSPGGRHIIKVFTPYLRSVANPYSSASRSRHSRNRRAK